MHTDTLEPREAVGKIRASEDPNDLRWAVDRQRKLIANWSELLDWPLVDEYMDNDTSAYQENVVRDDYERLVADIKAGRVKAIIAQSQDRIVRLQSDWGFFRRLCVKHDVLICLHEDKGVIDITTPSGMLHTGMRALMSEAESMIKSMRVRDAVNERAAAGKVSSRVLYGWRRVYEFTDQGIRKGWHDVPHSDHAPIVQECARRLVDGDTLESIIDDLNKRRVPPPSAHWTKNPATRWSRTSINSILKRPANVGQVVLHRKVVPGVEAQAPPLLDQDTYDRCLSILRDPDRRTATDNRVQHLLTGIARCGVCEGPVRFKRQRIGNGVCLKYACKRGHAGRRQNLVDAYVQEVLIDYLEKIDPADLLPPAADAADFAAKVAALKARRDRYEQDYDAEYIDGAEWAARKRDLDPQIEAARARASIAVSPGLKLAYRIAGGEDIPAAWDRLELKQKRMLIAAVLKIRILRVGGNSRLFRPEDIKIDPTVPPK